MSEADTITPAEAPAPPFNSPAVQFWMVWNKHGMPRATHRSYDAAAREARRLASKYPGQKFIVLQAQRKFWIDAPEAAEFRCEDATPAEVAGS